MKRVEECILLPAAEGSEDEASTLSADYRSHGPVDVISPDWSPGARCDMCERGPSLSLGAWYSWCCGKPSLACSCAYEKRQRKRKSLMCKNGKNWKANDPNYPWSGKVHKLCGLWSAKVFEDSEQPWRMMGLKAAIQHSIKTKCSDPDCGLSEQHLDVELEAARRLITILVPIDCLSV